MKLQVKEAELTYINVRGGIVKADSKYEQDIGIDELMMLSVLANKGQPYLIPHWAKIATEQLVSIGLVRLNSDKHRLTKAGEKFADYLRDEGLI